MKLRALSWSEKELTDYRCLSRRANSVAEMTGTSL